MVFKINFITFDFFFNQGKFERGIRKYPKENLTQSKGKSRGRLAQLVERYPYKVDVTSSSLVMPTIFKIYARRLKLMY